MYIKNKTIVFSISITLVSLSVSAIEKEIATADKLKWPNGTVPYQLDHEFDATQLGIILKAFELISNSTCVKFVQRINETDFIYVKLLPHQSICLSEKGRSSGKQMLFLGVTSKKDCVQHGIILHHLMRVLGFPYEHQRVDQNRYVEINRSNINRSRWKELQTLSKSNFVYNVDEEPYDIESLMHLNNFHHAINQATPSMISKHSPENELGQRKGLTQGDMQKIRNAYKCNNSGHFSNNELIQSNILSDFGYIFDSTESPLNSANASVVTDVDRDLNSSGLSRFNRWSNNYIYISRSDKTSFRFQILIVTIHLTQAGSLSYAYCR
ncbi:unnamed protein product [Orchesella dallaii]|uniref:Metalloendopeptidase n=1 Tax=Orchesella dallaii TaxID=48710 RepID=A0ABP1QCS9_9HEXA